MRRLALLAVLALGVAACGGSEASKQTTRIEFGISGGLIAPYAVAIAPDGRLIPIDHVVLKTTTVSSAEDQKLSDDVRAALPQLKNQSCPGALPDVAAQYITALGRTVTVHGTCEPAFTKLWNELAKAAGVG